MSVPLLCIAFLAILVFGLGFSVSMTRFKTMTVYGYSKDPQNLLHKMIRAHSNTVEYAPFLALLIYLLSLSPQSQWVIGIMVLATFSRLLIVLGLVLPKSMDKPNPMRFLGAIGTYICGVIMAVLLLLQAVA